MEREACRDADGKGERMNTFVVVTAEVNGSLKTGLIDEDMFKEDPDPSSYFSPSAENAEQHGTVDISGPAEHMIPDYVIES